MMKNKKNLNKIIFIVCLSVFGAFWVASLLFLGFASFSPKITTVIQDAYSNVFKEKTLDLLKVTLWSTAITTTGLIITLLFTEIRKKYAK